MRILPHLFENNRRWARAVSERDPEFFRKLSLQQAPAYLWIGCSDSRVPANEIVGLLPGELFVHRNVANLVVHTDFNCLSVMQFAVDVLKIRHIIVCGHYGCSGVKAALGSEKFGLVDNWLRHLRDVREKHDRLLAGLLDFERRHDRLCELNVIEQVVNVCETSILEGAWQRGQGVTVHGWVYGLRDGCLRDLRCTVSGKADVAGAYETALADLG